MNKKLTLEEKIRMVNRARRGGEENTLRRIAEDFNVTHETVRLTVGSYLGPNKVAVQLVDKSILDKIFG